MEKFDMNQLALILRCCESDQKAQHRPEWFSKVSCLKNLVRTFAKYTSVELHAIHDGPIGPLYDILVQRNFYIDKINVNSNDKSLYNTLTYASGLPDYRWIYFVEDDYLHTPYAFQGLIDGLMLSQSTFITGYDHPDRYTRTDDLDYGRTNVYLGNRHYWRTAESTTCTWAISQDDYLEFGFELAMKHGLNDRAFFREALTMGKRLVTPMPGLSTHCHIPFMSPFVDWEIYNVRDL
jgi:hypothetical protein